MAKLGALGELCSGIVHELNQPLTFISAIIELALGQRHDLPRNIGENISLARYAAKRMAGSISNIRTFARQTPDVQLPIEPRDVIRRATGLVDQQLKVDGIELKEGQFEPDVFVRRDAINLQQVFLNLLINVKGALLGPPIQPHKEICLSVFGTGETVVLKIEDSRPGIPEDIRRRVSDAFLSTKEVEKGNGLDFLFLTEWSRNAEVPSRSLNRP